MLWKARSPHPSEAGIAAYRVRAYARRGLEPDLLLHALDAWAAHGWHAHAFTEQAARNRVAEAREDRRERERREEKSFRTEHGFALRQRADSQPKQLDVAAFLRSLGGVA